MAPLLFSMPEYFITSFDRSSSDVDVYNVIYPWLIVYFHYNLERNLFMRYFAVASIFILLLIFNSEMKR